MRTNARAAAILRARYILLAAQEQHTDARSEGYQALHRVWVYLSHEYESCR